MPAWNYVAVHAHGPVEFFEEMIRLLDVVRRLNRITRGGAERTLGNLRLVVAWLATEPTASRKQHAILRLPKVPFCSKFSSRID